MPGRLSEHWGRRWRWIAGTAVVTACSLGAAIAGADVDSTPDAGSWVTDGPVYSIARSGDRTFIAGDFSHVGPRTGSGVPLAPLGDAEAGKLEPGLGSFPEVYGGRILTVLPGPAASWYIGGDFTSVGGTARSGLARLVPRSSGELVVDPAFDPQPEGAVHALARGVIPGKDDHVLYVGGKFLSLGGDPNSENFGAVQQDTGAAIGGWKSPDDTVTGIDVLRQTDTSFPIVFLVGEFDKLGDVDRQKLAAIKGVGSTPAQGAVTDWSPTSLTAPPRTIYVGPARRNADETQIGAPVFVGGDFGLLSAKFTLSLTDESTSGFPISSADPAFTCDSPGCTATVRAIAASGDGTTLYLGGRFDQLTPPDGSPAVPRRNLAAIRGIVDPFEAFPPPFVVRGWDPSPDDQVHELVPSPDAADAGALYVGGDFTQMRDGGGFSPRVGLAAIAESVSTDANDAHLLPWDPVAAGGLDGQSVTALAATSDAIYGGGSFTSIGGSNHENVAAIDASGRVIESWTGSTNAPVDALTVGNERVYLGGRFTQAGNEARGRLAAVAAADGALDEQFDPSVDPTCTGAGCSSGVLSLALKDQTLYVGGSFGSLAGASRANAGAVDATTGAIKEWAPGPDGNVYALLATCGTVYAGGAFDTAGRAPRGRIAALDPVTGDATDWNPSAESGAVYTLARDAETVYAGGSFARIGGTERRRIAALDATTGEATSWNARLSGTGDVVRAIAVPAGGSVVYAGGRFTTAGGAARASLAALDRTDASARSWDPQADAGVRALVSDGASALVGGEFRSLAGKLHHGFGSFGLGGAGAQASLTCERPEPPPPPPEPVVEAPPPPPPPVEPARDGVAPELTGANMTEKRFRTARPVRRRAGSDVKRRIPVGTRFGYTLSESAVVRFAFERRKALRCGSAKSKRRCYRWRRAGAVAHLSPAGTLKVHFDGRVGTRWLRAGRYRVRMSAVDAAGNESVASRLAFEVLRDKE